MREFDDNRRISVTEHTLHCEEPFQDGDYFGRTVNVAARITDYARPGEVLVSDQVVADADPLEAIRFAPVGPVSLKGLSTTITLYTAVHAR